MDELDDPSQRPQLKPLRRSARVANSDGTLTDPEETAHMPAAEAAYSTPKPRPKPTAAYKARSPVSSPTGLPSASSPSRQEHVNGDATPVSRKRARPETENEPANEWGIIEEGQSDHDSVE